MFFPALKMLFMVQTPCSAALGLFDVDRPITPDMTHARIRDPV